MKQRQPTRTHPLPRALASILMAVFLSAVFLFATFTAEARAEDQVIPQNIAPDVGDVLKSGRYQTEIPHPQDGNSAGASDNDPFRASGGGSPDNAGTGAPSGQQGSGDGTDGGGAGMAGGPESAPPNSPSGFAGGDGLMQVVIYGMVGLLGILILLAILKARRGKMRPAEPGIVRAVSTPVAVSAPGPRPVPLDQVEALAAAGQFEAAIHLMLLRALAALRTRLGELPDSLTSREILRRSNLPRDAAQPLSVIIGAVEVSHFGGQSPNEAVYRLCVERYRQFLGSAA